MITCNALDSKPSMVIVSKKHFLCNSGKLSKQYKSVNIVNADWLLTADKKSCCMIFSQSYKVDRDFKKFNRNCVDFKKFNRNCVVTNTFRKDRLYF